MKNYLMIDGKKIELTDKQVKILTEEPEKGIWRKSKDGESYWYFNISTGMVDKDNEIGHYCDTIRFENGNYCLEKEPLERERLDIILYQRLKRFSYQRGWDKEIWKDSTKKKWYLWYDADNEKWKVDWTFCCYEPMQVYFMSEEIAKQAIEEIIKPFCEEFPEYLGGE